MGHSCDESVLIICYLRTSPDDVVPEVWLCGDLQNGPQKKLEVFSTLSLPIRSVTPSPDSSQTMPADEPSAFDVTSPFTHAVVTERQWLATYVI